MDEERETGIRDSLPDVQAIEAEKRRKTLHSLSVLVTSLLAIAAVIYAAYALVLSFLSLSGDSKNPTAETIAYRQEEREEIASPYDLDYNF